MGKVRGSLLYPLRVTLIVTYHWLLSCYTPVGYTPCNRWCKCFCYTRCGSHSELSLVYSPSVTLLWVTLPAAIGVLCFLAHCYNRCGTCFSEFCRKKGMIGGHLQKTLSCNANNLYFSTINGVNKTATYMEKIRLLYGQNKK